MCAVKDMGIKTFANSLMQIFVLLKWKQTIVLPSCFRIIVGANAEKTAGSLSVFHRVETTDNTGQNVSVFIHLVSNGE